MPRTDLTYRFDVGFGPLGTACSLASNCLLVPLEEEDDEDLRGFVGIFLEFKLIVAVAEEE